jgi:peptidoglycan-associated lipoprotein
MRSVPVPVVLAIMVTACAHSQPPPAPPAPQPEAVAQPPAQAAPAPVAPPAPRTVEVVAASIYFDFDSSELSPDTRSTLQTFYDQARQRPDLNARIEGNCDERGTEEYNLALGQRRADSAKGYLVSLGLDASRIKTISYGKERPRAPGHDEAAWRENRRADLVPVTTAVGQASR